MDAQEKAPKKRRFKGLKIALWTIFGFLILIIGGASLAAKLILTPEFITGKVREYAPENLRTGTINVTVLKNFPNLEVDISELSYTWLRDSVLAETDSLHATGISLSINYFDALKGELGINRASADAFVALAGIGEISAPLFLSGRFRIPEKDFSRFSISDLKARVAMIELDGEAEVAMGADSTYLRAEASIDGCKVAEVASWIGESMFAEAKKLKTDAVVSLTALCDGYYIPSTKELPELVAEIVVPDAGIAYEGIDYKGDIAAIVNAMTDVYGNLTVTVDELHADFLGICLHGSGSAEDLLSTDPLFGVDLTATASLDTLSAFLPEGLIAEGTIEADFSGMMFQSDMDIYNFALADIEGGIRGAGITVRDSSDSLHVFMDHVNLHLEHLKNGEFGAERLGIHGVMDTLHARYGPSVFARGSGLDMTLQNAPDTETERFGREEHPLVGTISAESLVMAGSDSLFLGMRGSRNTFRFSGRHEGDSTLPILAFRTDNDGIFVRQGVTRAGLTDASFDVSAERRGARKRRERQNRTERRARTPEPASDDFTREDFDFRLGETFARYMREWKLDGKMSIGGGRLITPYFPLENTLSSTGGSFNNNEILLDSLTINSGESDLSAKGKVSGLRRAMLRGGSIDMNLDVTSEYINANELLAAFDAGTDYLPSHSDAALDESISDEEYLSEIVTDSLAAPDSLGLLIVPGNINAKVTLEGGKIDWSELGVTWFASDIQMKDRCLQVVNTVAESNVGDIYFEGFYATRSKDDITAGFDLNLVDITADKVISLMPATDSIVPMLKAFKGMLDCEIAATTALDTMMNLKPESIRGVMKVSGRDLVLERNDALESLARLLMLKGRRVGEIDDMTVQGVISDNTLEVFPFVLGIDKYTLAMSGLQYFDQSFKYHVSVLKSPIPFRFGINLTGNFDDWKFRIGRAKYKNTNVPVFSKQINDMHLNLVDAIHNIFTKGVEEAVLQNQADLQQLQESKEQAGYTPDNENMQALTAAEQLAMETLLNAAETQ